MSLEENKVIVRSLIEAINNRSLFLLKDLFAQNFSYYTQGRKINGLDIIKQTIEEEVKGFPDLHLTIKDIIAEGDKIWILLEETGTHKGEFRGLAPTGESIKYECTAIWRIANGKIVEGWGVYDQMDFYKKLGVIEYKGFPDENVS